MRKPPTPTQAIDVLIGGGKQNGLQKKEKKERNREQVSNPATLDY